jgi:ClpX C4-type zinc finger protein
MFRQTLRCSFCRRADADVAKLVAGPVRIFSRRVFICDRCAVRTIEIMNDVSPGDQSPVDETSIVRQTLNRLGWRRDDVRGTSECRAW